MSKKIGGLLLFLVVFQGTGLNATHHKSQEYKLVPVNHQSWGKKFLKSVAYGVVVGSTTGFVCAGFDIKAPLYHFPIHWIAAYATRRVATSLIIENSEDEGRPVNKGTLETTSWLSSWGVWLGMVIPACKGTLYN